MTLIPNPEHDEHDDSRSRCKGIEQGMFPPQMKFPTNYYVRNYMKCREITKMTIHDVLRFLTEYLYNSILNI